MPSVFSLDIEEDISEAVRTAFEEVRSKAGDDLAAGAFGIQDYELVALVLSGSWSNDRAEIGDGIDVTLLMEVDGEYEPEAANFITTNMESFINTNISSISEKLANVLGEFSFGAAPFASLDSVLPLLLGRAEGNTVLVWDYRQNRDPFVEQLLLESEQAAFFQIQDEDEESLQQFRFPLDEFKEELQRQEAEDDEPGIPTTVGPAIEELERIEPTLTRMERLFPELPDQIRQSVTENGFVNAPAGRPTKKVAARDLYDFEYRMGLTMTRLEREGFDRGEQLDAGVGFYTDMGMVGLTGGQAKPPSHFPWTTMYIRNRLLFEGPAYPLQIFNDLVIYSLFISNEYDRMYKPSSYSNIRLMIDRIKRLEEEGMAPQLIRKIPKEEAESRGFDTTPQLPSGQDAPWLEDRQFYEIIEENADNDAWRNVNKELYGD